jgi:glycosyltransferase involved in cell wall biosynthesis
MLSIIIPSRNDEFLQKTIDCLIDKAEGEIEIIVVLDGYWPVTPIINNPKVIIIHHGTQFDNKGMRSSINKGMAIAKGEYVMKIDEHCNVDQGYDVKLAADCEDNWVVTPRRHRLDLKTWGNVSDGRPPVDYNFLAYPYARFHDHNCGLHGEIWKRPERDHILIDDAISMQGSCYFTTRKWWFEMIGPMDEESYGPFTHEAQEISMKSIMGGGEFKVNKKTWYSHLHKGKTGKKYGFSNVQYRRHGEYKERGRLFCIDFWINDKTNANWGPEKRKRTFKWFFEEFGPFPGWPDNWEEQLIIDNKIEHAK